MYLLDRERCPYLLIPLRKLTTIAAVLGDSGRLYVAPEVVPIYRDALPLATIITPNWFEVECVACVESVYAHGMAHHDTTECSPISR